MILPDKNIDVQNSFLGIGAIILGELKASDTVSSLWDKVRKYEQVQYFEKFVYALDLLFTMGLVYIKDGLLWRSK